MIERVRLSDKPQSLPAKPQSSPAKPPSLPVKSQLSPVKPPKELARFFADPPLVGSERPEEYENLFAEIAAAAKPADAIAWLLVRDITDLWWDIRRERRLKVQAIRIAQEVVVARFLSPRAKDHYAPTATPEAQEEAAKWASDPKARLQIEKKLAGWGYHETYILAEAFKLHNAGIDAFDARIASYEVRRMSALRMIELYNEKLARRLEAASSKVIEGEFTEAAE